MSAQSIAETQIVIIYTCAKMMLLPHHNRFAVLLKSQYVESWFVLSAAAKLTLNNYALRILKHMAQVTENEGQPDTTLAIRKGMQWTEHTLIIWSHGWEKNLSYCGPD